MDETKQIKILEEKLKPIPALKGRYPKDIMKERKEIKARLNKVSEVREAKNGKLKEVRRMDLFLKEWLKNGGNATRAAEKIFNCKSLSVASAMGSAYLKRARTHGMIMLERKGITYEYLLEMAIQKAKESKDPHWWDRLMKIAGHERFVGEKEQANTTNVINVVQTEKSILDKYMTGDVDVVDYSDPLLEQSEKKEE